MGVDLDVSAKSSEREQFRERKQKQKTKFKYLRSKDLSYIPASHARTAVSSAMRWSEYEWSVAMCTAVTFVLPDFFRASTNDLFVAASPSSEVTTNTGRYASFAAVPTKFHCA